MEKEYKKKVENLVVDTTAFIQNSPLHEVAENIITCQEVVDEIKSKRQLRRLIVLPYDLVIKDVFPEDIKIITDFCKKTGDFCSLSATDIKIMALTYQLEKEKNGISHLCTEPIQKKPIFTTENKVQMDPDVTGFFIPGKIKNIADNKYADYSECKEKCNESIPLQGDVCVKQLESIDLVLNENIEENILKLPEKFDNLQFGNAEAEFSDTNVMVSVATNNKEIKSEKYSFDENYHDSEDENCSGWITPSNVHIAKNKLNSQLMEDKYVSVACMTTDFAMQNVLLQMNLSVSALDGRIISQLRTYVLRCYACFKITSVMTKKFCPKCGNNTLKKVSYSLVEGGSMQIHINPKKPLTGKGRKFSLPRIKGGKHPNNPILVEDQPMPQNRPSRLARTKNNPLDDDYVAGLSPFVARDVNSKSAQLCIRPGSEFKHWMTKNLNETRKRRK